MTIDMFPPGTAIDKHSAVAIGNFDGVHIGHRTLIAAARDHAVRNGLAPVALTFNPHPASVVAPERVAPLITTLDQRIALLGDAGARRIAVLRFTAAFARLTPEDFVRQCLIGALRAKAVFVGENFRFGFKQAGTPEVLRALGAELGFETFFLPPVLWRGQLVSSTAVRLAISKGDVGRAGRLLGRCFTLEGPVVGGRGVGSKQTVPTLNIRPPEGLVIPRGVYTTETFSLDSGGRWGSITNCGVRPTFGDEELTVETYLLDPLTTPSPARIKVAFRRFIREEKRFASAEDLRAQIMRDVGDAQRYWRRLSRYTEAG